MLKYRALQFSVFILLILSVLFLFNACNKDALIDDESIGYRADYSDLSGQNLEFYNWFNQMRATHDYNNQDSIVSPFYFNIDWHSGSYFQYFGNNTLVYNVLNGDDEISQYSRIQVMITKKPDNNYIAKMLFYRADSTYYEKNFIYPSLYNFTGAVFEVTKFQSGIDNIYILQNGNLVKTFTHAELQQKYGDRMSLRSPRWPWVTCDGKFHFRDFFNWVGDVIGYGIKDFGDWMSDMFEDFGDWWNGWHEGGDSGGSSGWSYGGGSFGGFNGSNFGDTGGSGGSSSGGSSNTGGANPWDKPINKANYDCAVENYKFLQENHPEFLKELNFWVPCSGTDYTLSALQYLCSKTNNNPSSSNNEIWQNFMDKWRKIRQESIADALECQNCALAFENFETKYGVTLDDNMRKIILQNMSTCTKQSEFDMITLHIFLKEYFGIGISEVIMIDNIIFAIDVNGVLRIKIPKIDMYNSSNEAIFNQFLNVLNAVNKYYCQTKTYKPIDWRDYFIHCGDKTFTINWNGCSPVALDFSTMAGERFITDTTPSWQNHSSYGDPRYYYELKFANTNIQALRFTLPYACEEEFYDLAFPQCH